ncbi:MAG: hypothetical protein ATN35_05755 [Epulopiscium sp. Nele67-Bin004]|nr:MAG: hypothetical protein ATN35_05755 [Epulopiscium sp. Nele67-Bin004]
MLLLLLLILCVSPLYGAINDLAETYYSQVSPNGKILTNAEDMGLEIDKIYLYTKNQKLSERDGISLDAFYLYLTNKIYSGDKLSAQQVKALEDKRNEMLAYMKSNPVDSAFITVLADIGFVMSTYKSLPTLISISKQNLKFYEQAIKMDNTFFMAYIRMAMWYYYAPKYGGGSLDKTLDYLNQAEKYAVTKREQLELYLWRSQVYFRKGEEQKAEEEIKIAHNMFPDNMMIQKAIDANVNGEYYK